MPIYFINCFCCRSIWLNVFISTRCISLKNWAGCIDLTTIFPQSYVHQHAKMIFHYRICLMGIIGCKIFISKLFWNSLLIAIKQPATDCQNYDYYNSYDCSFLFHKGSPVIYQLFSEK